MPSSPPLSLACAYTYVMAASTEDDRAGRFKIFLEKHTKIIQFLRSGAYEPGLSKVQKRVLRRQAKNFTFDVASK